MAIIYFSIFAFACFLNALAAFAFDTYYFRASLSSRNQAQIKILVEPRGRNGERQPFINTHILQQPDTNYILIKITPKNTADDVILKQAFLLPGFDLYQVYSLTEYGEPILKQDNSALFPMNKNWTIETNSK